MSECTYDVYIYIYMESRHTHKSLIKISTWKLPSKYEKNPILVPAKKSCHGAPANRKSEWGVGLIVTNDPSWGGGGGGWGMGDGVVVVVGGGGGGGDKRSK